MFHSDDVPRSPPTRSKRQRRFTIFTRNVRGHFIVNTSNRLLWFFRFSTVAVFRLATMTGGGGRRDEPETLSSTQPDGLCAAPNTVAFSLGIVKHPIGAIRVAGVKTGASNETAGRWLGGVSGTGNRRRRGCGLLSRRGTERAFQPVPVPGLGPPAVPAGHRPAVHHGRPAVVRHRRRPPVAAGAVQVHRAHRPHVHRLVGRPRAALAFEHPRRPRVAPRRARLRPPVAQRVVAVAVERLHQVFVVVVVERRPAGRGNKRTRKQVH